MEGPQTKIDIRRTTVVANTALEERSTRGNWSSVLKAASNGSLPDEPASLRWRGQGETQSWRVARAAPQNSNRFSKLLVVFYVRLAVFALPTSGTPLASAQLMPGSPPPVRLRAGCQRVQLG